MCFHLYHGPEAPAISRCSFPADGTLCNFTKNNATKKDITGVVAASMFVQRFPNGGVDYRTYARLLHPAIARPGRFYFDCILVEIDVSAAQCRPACFSPGTRCARKSTSSRFPLFREHVLHIYPVFRLLHPTTNHISFYCTRTLFRNSFHCPRVKSRRTIIVFTAPVQESQ